MFTFLYYAIPVSALLLFMWWVHPAVAIAYVAFVIAYALRHPQTKP